MAIPTPAEIVRSILLKAEYVIFPGLTLQPDDPTLTCFVNQMPDSPDFALFLHDMHGTSFGRLQTGKYTSHPGVRITCRALDALQGSDAIWGVAYLLNARTCRQSVPIRGVECFIASIYQTCDVLSLGEEIGTKRLLWTYSVQVALEDTDRFIIPGVSS